MSSPILFQLLGVDPKGAADAPPDDQPAQGTLWCSPMLLAARFAGEAQIVGKTVIELRKLRSRSDPAAQFSLQSRS